MKKITLLLMLFAVISINAQKLSFYSIAQNNNSSPHPTWHDLSASGTTLYTDGDDDETANISIGFDFYYRDHKYTTVTAGINGAISFTETQIYNSNDLSSTGAGEKNMIAPFWDDLRLYGANNGYLGYETVGTAPNREFRVIWKNISRFNDSGKHFSMQVILYEGTNKIAFVYGHVNTGIVNGSGSIGFNYYDGSNTEFLSVTPGTPPAVSFSTANNLVHLPDLPANKNYVFTPGRPSNDYDSQAFAIPALTTAYQDINAFNIGATNSFGHVPTCANFQGGDVWYTFTAPAYGAVKLNRPAHTDWGTMGYAVYHNTYASDPIICDFLSEGTALLNHPKFLYNLKPGDTYYLRMWDYGNNDFGVETFQIAAMSNDGNHNSFPVDVQPESASDYTITYANNVGATNSPNGTPTGCSNNGYSGGDVWFSFVAPANGQIALVVPAQTDWSSVSHALYTSSSSNTNVDCGTNYTTNMASTTFPVTHIYSGLTAGQTYYLRMYDYNNDHFGIANFYLRVDTTSGVEDYTSLDFKYYPNPATDVINVSAKNEIQTITITNITGQVVLQVMPNQNETQLNIAHLPKGMYLMSVNMGDHNKTVKIIKN